MATHIKTSDINIERSWVGIGGDEVFVGESVTLRVRGGYSEVGIDVISPVSTPLHRAMIYMEFEP
jgi:hypothetical protein